MSRSTRTQRAVVLAAGVLVLSACSSSSTPGTSASGSSNSSSSVAVTSSAAAPASSSASAAGSSASAMVSAPASSGASSSSATLSGAGKTIAFIPGCTCDPYYSTETKGFQDAMKASGATPIVQGPADFNPAQQITVLSAVIQKKPDAIIIDPTDATALAAPIEAAVAAGIPVMTTGNNVNTAKVFTAIAASSVEGGKLAAQELIKERPEGGELVFVHIKPGISSIDDREKGFRAALAGNSKFTILNNLYAGSDSAAQAASLVAPVITSHPKLVGIFASNVITANGAANAITTSGKIGEISAIGYDAGAQEITDLQAGALTAVISQNPYKIGQLAVQNTLKKLAGDASIPKDQPLTPLVITKENLNNPDSQSAIYK